MLKPILIASGVATIVVAGGSLIHPPGLPIVPGAQQAILRGTQIDPETVAIVRRACQNCHSEEAAWPWYSHIAPVSWLVTHDVRQARSYMNLSHWQDYSTNDRLRLLSAMGSAVRNREMPVERYVLLHPEARLTDAERQKIYQWTRSERGRLKMASNQP